MGARIMDIQPSEGLNSRYEHALLTTSLMDLPWMLWSIEACSLKPGARSLVFGLESGVWSLGSDIPIGGILPCD